MDKIEVFKVGELMTMSSGEYSDYCVQGLFKVIIDFDAQQKLAEWAEENGKELKGGGVYSGWSSRGVDFLGWLNSNNYIAEIEYRELHLGGYGDTRLSQGRTP